jgi:hypothetical protein
VHRDNGSTKAITVTKNVWFHAGWVLNFHVWDNADPRPLNQIGSVDLSALLRPDGFTVPLPWHVCARVSGARVDTVVWLPGQTKPAYGDPYRGGSVFLPTGWTYPGKPGWYIGHLQPGTDSTLTDLTVSDVGSVADATLTRR